MSASTKSSPVKKEAKQTSKSEPGVAAGAAGATASNGNGNNGEGNEGNEEEPDYSILSDPEDYLEENESLDMNLKNGQQKIWLVKLPRYLAEKWSNIDQISGQQLGG